MDKDKALRKRLDAAIAASRTTAPHLVPLYLAARDNGIGLMVVWQHSDSFLADLKSLKGPSVILIADDTDRAVGPDHFHRKSLRHLASIVGGALVVSGAPVTDLYATMVINTIALHINTVIVETRPEHEIPWVNALRNAQPNLPMILSTFHGGHA